MAEAESATIKRQPIRNFIILPEFQWPYIIRLLSLVNLAGIIMASAICAFFYFRFRVDPTGGYAPGPAEAVAMSALAEENMMDVIIPAFAIADLVSLAIGLGISLYFSRKISVPLYRIGKWADAVSGGDLANRLQFRPGDDLGGLEEACNRVGETYLKVIEDLRRQVGAATSVDAVTVAADSTVTADGADASPPGRSPPSA